MSSRALKKLYENELTPSPVLSSKSDSEEEVVIVKKTNPFALLNDEEDEKEEEEEEEKVKEEKEEKEEKVEEQKEEKVKLNETPKPSSTSSKKKKKKKKKSTQTNTDIDELISQLESSSTLQNSRNPSYLKFLQLDTKDLDYEHEFRKLFGKQALKDSQNQASNANDLRNALRSTPAAHLLASWGGRDGRSFPGSSRKLVLAKIKDHYAPTIKRDIRLEQLSTEEDNGIVDFKFVHSPEYKEAQMIYEYTRSMGDVQAMVSQVMSKTPYHVPTLLVLAENRSQTGNHSEAADFLEQALLTFDRGLKSDFTFTTGQCRLPFRYFENRSFYLVIFEYIKSLMRRGTWQTAFTYTKLLWGLDPEDDPYGAGLMIDFFAMNAGNYQYIIDIANEGYFNQAGSGYYTRPNLLYSKALAHYTKTKGTDLDTSNEYLKQAISKFPWVAADLLGYHTAEEEVYNYDGVFSSTAAVDNEQLIVGPEQAIYSLLYSTQMKTFWEVAEIRSWLQNNCKSPTLVLEPIHQSIGVSLSLIRYVMVSQQTQTFRYIPQEVLSREIWSDDPFPPIDNISPYPERV